MKNPFKKEKEESVKQDMPTKTTDAVSGKEEYSVNIPPVPPTNQDYKALFELAMKEIEKIKQDKQKEEQPDIYVKYLTDRYGKVENIDQLIGLMVTEFKEIKQALKMPPFN